MPGPADRQLARLAAAVGPLRRVMAAVAAYVVETRAYERLCFARLSDYARERPGVSARQIQELARVHRALEALPRLEWAMVANELPWSKVRLVVRVAEADDEQHWIERARGVSTRQLEKDVKAVAREQGSADESSEDAATQRVAIRCTHAQREKWSVVCEVAERMSGCRLAAGDVLELVAAEAFSSLALDPSAADQVEGRLASPDRAEPHDWAQPSAARALAAHLPSAVLALARGLESADAFDLDRRLVRAVALEQTLDAAMAPLLRIVRCAEYEWSDRYRPMPVFAREDLGMSASKARALVQIERAGDVCPELREAYRAGRLSWVKARCLLPLLRLDLGGGWRPRWVAWAERVTVRRLAEDVERALLLRAGHRAAWRRCQFDPERAQDPIPEGERQLCAHDVDVQATEKIELRVPRDVAVLFVGVRETLRRLLSDRADTETGSRRFVCDGEVFEALMDLALASWLQHEPGARRPDPVIERDGYRCTVPGCTTRRSLHDHHVMFRSAGGSNEPDNRITLCAFHHLRCLHAGRMRVRGLAPDGLVFELGVAAGEPPLVRYRSGDVRLAPAEEETMAA